jgi:hypothetical protein
MRPASFTFLKSRHQSILSNTRVKQPYQHERITLLSASERDDKESKSLKKEHAPGMDIKGSLSLLKNRSFFESRRDGEFFLASREHRLRRCNILFGKGHLASRIADPGSGLGPSLSNSSCARGF